MVEKVCAFLEQLRADGITPRPVSVNFSRWHLHEEDMPRRLAGVVDAHGLERSLIVVEITESAMIDEEERMRQMVAELHEQGFYFDKPMPAEAYRERLINRDIVVAGEDILQIQSETAAVQLLLQAVCMRYPLIIYGNLTRNSFYMMTYDNFTSRGCPSTGSVDDLIAHGAMSMHPDDRELWRSTLCRENQLKLHGEGAREIHLISRQIGDDGIYRRVETSNYFVKSPASEDVLVISLCNNLDG